MAKKLSINEKEVFDIFKNYDKTSILFKYKYTEQEKKSEDALNRSLRRKWIATLKKKGIKPRSEEHTSELQSRLHLVCRLLLEKKKTKTKKKKKKTRKICTS